MSFTAYCHSDRSFSYQEFSKANFAVGLGRTGGPAPRGTAFGLPSAASSAGLTVWGHKFFGAMRVDPDQPDD